MPEFVETAVDAPEARMLLDEYFEFRAAGFPVAGGYRTVHPAPAAFERPHGVFVVVREGDDVLGCGGIRMLSPTRAEVKHLWVRPAAQGRGLGRALLGRLEELAAGLGATEAVLDTNASLEAAGSLYRSSGYESIEPYNDNPNATHWYRKVLVRVRRRTLVGRAGAVISRGARISYAAFLSAVALVGFTLGVGLLTSADEPVYWGTYTESSCEGWGRAGCHSRGTWVSDGGTIQLANVRLDGHVGPDGTVVASYRPTGFLNDYDNWIVHTEWTSGLGLWVPWGLGVGASIAAFIQIRPLIPRRRT
ncbi:GNAT family N-acetyltransferase [Schumannella luteola]